MHFLSRQPSDPAPDAEWQVWYRDTFDLECPPSVDVSGRGLAQGLVELWARHLFETVRPGGGQGFSRFHLWWKGERSVQIKGSWEGLTRLRGWVFGAQAHTRKGYVEAGDARLLRQIAGVHARMVLADGSCEPIVAAAAEAAGREDFERRLGALTTGA
jgi:hypothetical protein